MAIVNLLRNTISGKIGNSVGIVKNGKNYFQSLPMGKTKYPPESREALQQFQSFVRFCNAFTKAFPDLYSRYNRSMTNKNYACKIFSSCYVNKKWIPDNAVNIIHTQHELRIKSASFVWSKKLLSVEIETRQQYKPCNGEQLCLLAFAGNGKFMCSLREPLLESKIKLTVGTSISRHGDIIIFLYRPLASGWYTTGFTMKKFDIIT